MHVVVGDMTDRAAMEALCADVDAVFCVTTFFEAGAQETPDPTELSGVAKLALHLPGFVRRLTWRLPQWFPRWWKEMAGTVAVTSVGMFGHGGGWTISPTNFSLQMTVGGISKQPRIIDEEITSREFLHLTVTFDHDVIDGAPAARSVQRVSELIEDSHGLDLQNEI